MLKKYLLSVYFLVFFFNNLPGQLNPYEPASILHFQYDEITEENIAEKISNHANDGKIFYSDNDIKELKPLVERNNHIVDSLSKYIEKVFIDFSSLKQDLLQFKDVEKINEHIDQLKKQRNEIQNQIQEKLENVQYEGLYIVVLDSISTMSSLQEKAKIAETALTKTAVFDLKNVYIESLTSANNGILEQDSIRLLTSGQMSITKQYYQSPLFKLQKYVCLVSVKVSPLKNSVVGSDYRTPESVKSHIINMGKDDYRQKLAELNIPENVVSEMLNSVNISYLMSSIASSNQNATANQISILKIGHDNLLKNQNEIDKLINEISNRRDSIKSILSQLSLPFDENNMQASLANAEKAIDIAKKDYEQAYINVNEKEIKEIDQKVTPQDPAVEIAKATIELTKRLSQSYSKVEMFSNEFIVNNSVPVSDETNQKKIIYRKLDEIWLYLVPDQGDFLIKVLARFIIDSQSKDYGIESSYNNEYQTTSSSSIPKYDSYNKKYEEKSTNDYHQDKTGKRWIRRIVFGGMTTGFAILGYKQHKLAADNLKTYQNMKVGAAEQFDNAYNSYKKRINYRNLSCSAAALTGTFFVISIPF